MTWNSMSRAFLALDGETISANRYTKSAQAAL